jgi:hypothetical protein
LSLPWRAAAAALESSAATCAALNLAYFLHRLLGPSPEKGPRRVAALVLALVSAGAMGEGAFVLAWLWAGGEVSWAWAAARLLPAAGTVGISALVLRGLADD